MVIQQFNQISKTGYNFIVSYKEVPLYFKFSSTYPFCCCWPYSSYSWCIRHCSSCPPSPVAVAVWPCAYPPKSPCSDPKSCRGSSGMEANEMRWDKLWQWTFKLLLHWWSKNKRGKSNILNVDNYGLLSSKSILIGRVYNVFQNSQIKLSSTPADTLMSCLDSSRWLPVRNLALKLLPIFRFVGQN